MDSLRIGTRRSELALIQTEIVIQKIKQCFPEIEIEVIPIMTKGDKNLVSPLSAFGGKGVFTKELEEALLNHEIDFAVHSAKDMTMELPEGLCIGAVLEREDKRDVLLVKAGEKIFAGSRIGTSSLRRALQIKEIYPQAEIKDLRGNVKTRLQKLRDGQYDGIILAAAGLKRLNLDTLSEFQYEYMEEQKFFPAAGQGILAIEAREKEWESVLKAVHSKESAIILEAERTFLKETGGGCNAPAGVSSKLYDNKLTMRVMFAKDGIHKKTSEECIEIESLEEISNFAKGLARKVTSGTVYLVGAGPGEEGLITKKGLQCIKRADAIIYDHLIPHSLLNEAQDEAELIYAGKRASNHHMKQSEINQLLVEKAMERKNVVRLKGGDPFIFGRGGEEAEILKEAGVAYEIVPGISSSYAAAAYAGIPVTHRNAASSFHVITGHDGDHKTGIEPDYQTLAKEEGTLVFLMGVQNLPFIVEKLVRFGKPSNTKAAVIQSGTTSKQKVAVSTLSGIVEEVKKKQIVAPAVILVGEVVGCQEKLNWYQKGKLSGISILLTGTKSMVDRQAELFSREGAEPIRCSLISVKKKENNLLLECIQNLISYTYAVFTSANGVHFFFDFLKEKKIDIRTLSHLRFAVIGEGTAKALEERGMFCDCIPTAYSSEELGKTLVEKLSKEDHVLLLRAREASKRLPELLTNHGISYEDLALYETNMDFRKKEELHRMVSMVDYITFTSASAVKAYASMMEGITTPKAKIICIGPVTEEAAKDCKLPVYGCATKYTAEGILSALLDIEGREEMVEIHST